MISLLLAIIYVSFISLGLPDALLGAAWPTMCLDFSVPVSYAGIVALIISASTVVSSLLAGRILRILDTGRVTAISVGMTAVALLGFSLSHEYWQLCLWAIPYGLGAGSVDASLNNYVAVHFASRHMSWLHCMWGLGASIGPYIMGAALTGGMRWNSGYRIIAGMQFVLTAVLMCTLWLWKAGGDSGEETGKRGKPLSFRQLLAIPGAREIMLAFFCYCGLEQTCILWGSSYFVLVVGLGEEEAASLASLFMLGITVGRLLSGFLTYKVNDENMIRLGEGTILLGVLCLFLPFGKGTTMAGLLLCGLGCAPVYPCIIHATPSHFGEERSQALIGIQMASAYVGICCMPPLFGLIANHISAGLLPVYLGAILVVMAVMNEQVKRKTAQ